MAAIVDVVAVTMLLRVSVVAAFQSLLAVVVFHCFGPEVLLEARASLWI